MRRDTDLTGLRVLVVEDEYFIATDMVAGLAEAGAMIVGPAATLRHAMQLLETGGPVDLAVLDINLRGESVYPLADALAERGVPFAFTTGYARLTLPPRFQGAPHWEKPYSPVDLLRGLNALGRADAVLGSA